MDEAFIALICPYCGAVDYLDERFTPDTVELNSKQTCDECYREYRISVKRGERTLTVNTQVM